MKKALLFSLICFSTLILNAFSNGDFVLTTFSVGGDCQYGQCSFVKKDGYQCKNCCQKDSYYCWSHRDAKN